MTIKIISLESMQRSIILTTRVLRNCMIVFGGERSPTSDEVFELNVRQDLAGSEELIKLQLEQRNRDLSSDERDRYNYLIEERNSRRQFPDDARMQNLYMKVATGQGLSLNEEIEYVTYTRKDTARLIYPDDFAKQQEMIDTEVEIVRLRHQQKGK